jgi:hypothetical protein
MLREEIRIKDPRMAAMAPQRRPHYVSGITETCSGPAQLCEENPTTSWRYFMKSIPRSAVIVIGAALSACGSGSSARSPSGTGGSAGGAGSLASGGAAGSAKTDAGATNVDSALATDDARAANVDQASPQVDAAQGPGSCSTFTPCGGDLGGDLVSQIRVRSQRQVVVLPELHDIHRRARAHNQLHLQ